MNPPPHPPGAEDRTAILKARARLLARESAPQAKNGSTLEIIEFTLAEERYAVEASFVSEVYPLDDLTPLPCTPSFVSGLVHVRGRICPVIDLKKFFDLPEQGIGDLHRILLVDTPAMEFGLLADTVVGAGGIPLDAIQPTLPTFTGVRAQYLRGVTAERLVILDVAAILADPRIIVHEEINP